MKQSSPLLKAVLVGLILFCVVFFGAKTFFLPDAEQQIAAVEEEPVISILVSSNRINQGHVMSSLDMEWRDLPQGQSATNNQISNDFMPDAVEVYTGRLALRDIPPGTPIAEAMLLDPENRISSKLRPGMRAMSIPIEPELAAGGLILPDDRVDLTVTEQKDETIYHNEDGNNRTEENTYLNSWVIMENLRVLAIDQQVMQEGDEIAIVGATATLEIPSDQITTVSSAVMTAIDGDRVLNVALRGMINPDGTPVESSRANTSFAQERGSTDVIKIIGFGRSISTSVSADAPVENNKVRVIPELSDIDYQRDEVQADPLENKQIPAPALLGDISTMSTDGLRQRTQNVDTSMALPGFEIEENEEVIE